LKSEAPRERESARIGRPSRLRLVPWTVRTGQHPPEPATGARVWDVPVTRSSRQAPLKACSMIPRRVAVLWPQRVAGRVLPPSSDRRTRRNRYHRCTGGRCRDPAGVVPDEAGRRRRRGRGSGRRKASPLRSGKAPRDRRSKQRLAGPRCWRRRRRGFARPLWRRCVPNFRPRLRSAFDLQKLFRVGAGTCHMATAFYSRPNSGLRT